MDFLGGLSMTNRGNVNALYDCFNKMTMMMCRKTIFVQHTMHFFFD